MYYKWGGEYYFVASSLLLLEQPAFAAAGDDAALLLLTFSSSVFRQVALTGSIDFLASQGIPFRLFYNYREHRPAKELALLPSRHVQNPVVWLVVVVIEAKWERHIIDLH